MLNCKYTGTLKNMSCEIATTVLDILLSKDKLCEGGKASPAWRCFSHSCLSPFALVDVNTHSSVTCSELLIYIFLLGLNTTSMDYQGHYEDNICPAFGKYFKTTQGLLAHLSSARSCSWWKKGNLAKKKYQEQLDITPQHEVYDMEDNASDNNDNNNSDNNNDTYDGQLVSS